ncbi:PREDICTED: aspartic proteinase-like protein 2 [Nelumbo nucifera]|uniref:Aspartic proteinase-like protein 2 n=1 Tax=Nelumbo nucifera TaxID=4432 RepID=A0A1U7YNG2_NELNU|nr:PREDICTED: aspartic proteinase-like protein 2 [Nelumbo nucifera]
MDLKRSICILCIVLVVLLSNVSANGVFRVQHKFAGRKRSLTDIKTHDGRRHRRLLANVDLPLGGDGHPASTGLYFAKIGIGTPPKDYYVQVDTGSDILWVNCIQCTRCPKKSDLGVELTLYDIKDSQTGKEITCDQDFCTSMYNGENLPGCYVGGPCAYSVVYGDGSTTTGYYIRDFVEYAQVSGNFQTKPANGSVVFGCGAKQSGDLGSSSAALDGILGFGQSNASMISQLASAGKMRKMFAHCLDNVNGGGIFAIGHVVQPKVKTTPMVPNRPHYNVNLKAIEVGGAVLQLPTDVFNSEEAGTIIDSGTTLAYLPDTVYSALMNQVMSQQPNLQTHIVEDQFQCFQYIGSVDDGFPVVTLRFENSLPLVVYPHDYLFQIREDAWCVGWQNSGLQSKDGKDMTLLGDIVLSNKLIVYDLENQTIGWTEYNCSSSIKVQDEQSGPEYYIGAHDVSSAWSWNVGWVIMLLLLTAMLHNLIY